MADNTIIKQMLEKADARPFYFGGSNYSYFWRVTEINGEIFAERIHVNHEHISKTYSYCLAYDKYMRDGIYTDIVIDFVTFYRNSWYYHTPCSAFVDVASDEDEELRNILEIFYKKYSDFLNDVLYWYSIVNEADFNEVEDSYTIKAPSELDSDGHLVKNILNRLYAGDPLVIESDGTVYFWEIVKAHGEIWYKRETQRFRDDYIYITEEYGHVPLRDVNAMDAIRDAVRSCFFLDGWELLNEEDNPDSILGIVGLSLEEVSA